MPPLASTVVPPGVHTTQQTPPATAHPWINVTPQVITSNAPPADYAYSTPDGVFLSKSDLEALLKQANANTAAPTWVYTPTKVSFVS